jgi:hypothetical protein
MLHGSVPAVLPEFETGFCAEDGFTIKINYLLLIDKECAADKI